MMEVYRFSVSYFEWVQGLQQFFWSEEEVNKELEQIMVKAFQETLNVHKKFGEKHELRIAAYILALHRVTDATRLRGIFP